MLAFIQGDDPAGLQDINHAMPSLIWNLFGHPE